VAEVENLRIGKYALELLAQPGLHLFLIDEDAVLGQTAGLDITVEQDHAMSRFGKLARAIDARRPRPDHNDQVLFRHSSTSMPRHGCPSSLREL
jgi:hypothetical protein